MQRLGLLFRTSYWILSTTYCILYRHTTHSAYQTISIPSVHTVVHLCATQVCCPEFISHKTAAIVRLFVSFFFVIIQLNQQYPSRFGCDVAALCIVGNSRWGGLVRCKLGFSSELGHIQEFFGYCRFSLCSHAAYYILPLGQISMYCWYSTMFYVSNKCDTLRSAAPPCGVEV